MYATYNELAYMLIIVSLNLKNHASGQIQECDHLYRFPKRARRYLTLVSDASVTPYAVSNLYCQLTYKCYRLCIKEDISILQ